METLENCGQAVKQVTILTLSELINGGINEIQAKLDSAFRRLPPDCKEPTVAQSQDNVLDEIISNMQRTRSRITDLHEFIYQVIEKIQ